MRRGVVAMMDALGFKGIWRTEQPDSVLEQLLELQRFLKGVCETATANWKNSFGRYTPDPPVPQVRMLSDTIFLAIEAGCRTVPLEKRPLLEGNLVNVCGYTIAQTLQVSTKFDPALVYSGAIAVGDFSVEDNFVIGPAVDEAAELMNKPDAAMIVLAQGETTELQRTAVPSMAEFGKLFMDFDMPLRGSDALPMRVLNPLALCHSPESQHDLLDGTKRAFRRSDKPSVQIKFQNTLKLFEHARSVL